MIIRVKPIDTAKQRLAIYKKALQVFRKHGGLCFLLQLISEGRPETSEDYEMINWRATSRLFPEFGHYYTWKMKTYGDASEIVHAKLFNTGRMKWREKVLEGCIKSCERQIARETRETGIKDKVTLVR